MIRVIKYRLASAAAALFLAACSYTPIYSEPQPAPGPTETPAGNYPPVEEASREADEIDKPPRRAVATPESVDSSRRTAQPSRTASSKLREQAELASDSGEYIKAQRILERALRIAPNEAATYYQLAVVKLRQGSPAQALQMARKGLSLGPDSEMQERLKVIEADAEMRAGG